MAPRTIRSPKQSKQEEANLTPTQKACKREVEARKAKNSEELKTLKAATSVIRSGRRRRSGMTRDQKLTLIYLLCTAKIMAQEESRKKGTSASTRTPERRLCRCLATASPPLPR